MGEQVPETGVQACTKWARLVLLSWPCVPNLHPAAFHVPSRRFPSQRQGGALHPWALSQTESTCLGVKAARSDTGTTSPAQSLPRTCRSPIKLPAESGIMILRGKR